MTFNFTEVRVFYSAVLIVQLATKSTKNPNIIKAALKNSIDLSVVARADTTANFLKSHPCRVQLTYDSLNK